MKGNPGNKNHVKNSSVMQSSRRTRTEALYLSSSDAVPGFDSIGAPDSYSLRHFCITLKLTFVAVHQVQCARAKLNRTVRFTAYLLYSRFV